MDYFLEINYFLFFLQNELNFITIIKIPLKETKSSKVELNSK